MCKQSTKGAALQPQITPCEDTRRVSVEKLGHELQLDRLCIHLNITRIAERYMIITPCCHEQTVVTTLNRFKT